MRKKIEAIRFVLKRFYRYWYFLITDFAQLKKRISVSKGTLLLVRLDAIGDYVIFRNFIKCIKESEKYKNYSITLCGNLAWKDLAEKFDSDIIDEFIWIDRIKFEDDHVYRHDLLKTIRNKGFEIAVHPTYSREFLYGDSIIRASRSTKRIGNSGDLANMSRVTRLFCNCFYTDILTAKKDVLFEFYRNKEFFEWLLAEKIGLSKPSFNLQKNVVQKKYAVIMPGASTKSRQWSPENFAKVAIYLNKKYKLLMVIAGGSQDVEIAKEIENMAHDVPTSVVAGKMKLPEFVELVSDAKILISNETSSVHIGLATDTPTVCISKGNRFGRFDPYPVEISRKVLYAYPSEIKRHILDFRYLSSKYKNASNFNLDGICAEEVCGIIDSIIYDNGDAKISL